MLGGHLIALLENIAALGNQEINESYEAIQKLFLNMNGAQKEGWVRSRDDEDARAKVASVRGLAGEIRSYNVEVGAAQFREERRKAEQVIARRNAERAIQRLRDSERAAAQAHETRKAEEVAECKAKEAYEPRNKLFSEGLARARNKQEALKRRAEEEEEQRKAEEEAEKCKTEEETEKKATAEKDVAESARGTGLLRKVLDKAFRRSPSPAPAPATATAPARAATPEEYRNTAAVPDGGKSLRFVVSTASPLTTEDDDSYDDAYLSLSEIAADRIWEQKQKIKVDKDGNAHDGDWLVVYARVTADQGSGR
ncbi:hypothetical protein SODALDRAFT_330774, partial [Sodiomyces alkalinus F11]